MRSEWILSTSVLLLYSCGSSEENIQKLGDDIERYAYRADRHNRRDRKIDYVFTGCQVDVARFIRVNRAYPNPFERRPRTRAKAYLSKIDAGKVEVIGDYVVAPCSSDTMEPFAKFGVGHEMGAECSCKITPSKGICTWLAMGFPGTTTLPDNKSRFLANFAKGSMDCFIGPNGPGTMSRLITRIDTDAEFIMKVQSGRAADVARSLTALIKACD